MPDTLPITTLKDRLLTQWQHGGVIVSAPPGSGKTTQLPLWLLSASNQPIYLLIPKRLAVKLAAEQLAKNLQQPIGQTVGYLLRHERQISQQTRLTVTTYGTFLQLLLNEPDTLSGSTIIFDEFHERALEQDLCYALVNHLVSELDDSIKRIFMSATMNSAAMAEQTGLTHLQADGRSYPITIRHQKSDVSNSKAVAHFIQSIWQPQDDHILVFCAGLAEMRNLDKQLPEQCPRLLLHSQLNNTPDLHLLTNAPATIILATNIAESSITLPRVHTVIDLGTERYADTHPLTGLTELKTRKISRASATQRAGRAGRLQEGTAWRLWSEDEQQSLIAFQPPEILQAELTQLVLQCLAWGASQDELAWLDPPGRQRWQLAFGKLQHWGAISATGQLTRHGQAMMKLGVEPWLAHLLASAEQQHCLSASILFAAHLTANVALPYSPFVGCKLHQIAPAVRQEAINLAKRLNHHLEPTIPPLAASFLVSGLSERLIYWRDGQSGQYFSGTETARTASGSPGWALLLSGQRQGKKILVRDCLDLTEDAIFEVLTIDKQCQFQAGRNSEFIEVSKLGNILLKSQAVTPDDRSREQAWQHYIATHGEQALTWSTEALALKTRWQFAGHINPNFPAWPRDDQWSSLTAPFLSGLKKLKDLPVLNVLHNHLGYETMQWLTKNLPATWQAPSGRLIPVNYDTDNLRASVDLKLQEAFGLTDQPKLNAQQPISLNLQAPNGRAVASVTDISYFWISVYPEVRKELRGRYAKHPWPEDPVNSLATSKTNRQLRNS